jgi:hypothetical protein
MARTPDGLNKRAVVTSFRLEPAEVDQLDEQAMARGAMSRSTYLRWLVNEDKKKIAKERRAIE